MPIVDEHMQQIRECIPRECLWVVSDEAVLRAIRLETTVHRGPRGQILRQVLQFVRWRWLQLTVVLASGIVGAVRQLIAQVSTPTRQCVSSSEQARIGLLTLFVGFGARAEDKLFGDFREHVSGEVIRINQVEIRTMACVSQVGPFTLFREIFSALGKVQTAIERMPVCFEQYRLEYLVFAAMRLAVYAHAKAWFGTFLESNLLREACFLSPDTAAFAAIDSGVSCHFYQHGLLSKSVMIPEFQRISALTLYESAYLRDILPSTEVQQILQQCPAVRIADRDTVVVASANRLFDEMMLAIPFIRDVVSNGLTVHLRPFVGENVDLFWESQRVKQHVPFLYAESGGSFDDLLAAVRPLFVVSWGSTTLIDALYMGIIPVCVANLDDRYIEDTVFPLLRCCLHWPTDATLIRQVYRSQAAYDDVIERLRANEITGYEHGIQGAGL